jgi:hypothetical protein
MLAESRTACIACLQSSGVVQYFQQPCRAVHLGIRYIVERRESRAWLPLGMYVCSGVQGTVGTWTAATALFLVNWHLAVTCMVYSMACFKKQRLKYRLYIHVINGSAIVGMEWRSWRGRYGHMATTCAGVAQLLVALHRVFVAVQIIRLTLVRGFGSVGSSYRGGGAWD